MHNFIVSDFWEFNPMHVHILRIKHWNCYSSNMWSLYIDQCVMLLFREINPVHVNVSRIKHRNRFHLSAFSSS